MSGAYSTGAKWLHWLALNSDAYREMSFDIERRVFLSSAPQHGIGRHVFVQGLARAGTTILTRALYDTNQFASLTYSDMPFVMAPNLWRKITRRFERAIETHERAHGDGIWVDGNSPEALDEVFWKTFCGDEYIRLDSLTPHEPREPTLEDYGEFVRLVLLRYGKSRYLSKNNNNILRLSALARSWPDAHFLVPVRDPIAQAMSLRRQHQKFLPVEKFTQRYMDWLGHHEFGVTHRPFEFCMSQADARSCPADLEYWLQLWVETYRYLAPIVEQHANVRFISYTRLCADEGYWPQLCEALGLETVGKSIFSQQDRRECETGGLAPSLRDSAREFYGIIEARTGLAS